MLKSIVLALAAVTIALAVTSMMRPNSATAMSVAGPPAVEQVSNCSCKGNCACTTNNGTMKCRRRCGL